MPLPSSPAEIPADVLALIAEAERRIDLMSRAVVSHAFIPSDFNRVYRALRAIADSSLTAGHRFCEWGSGLGVNVCLASKLGFHAGGIEIEPTLVAAARQLAADFDIAAEFIHGSFLPEGSDECLDAGEPFAWLSTRRAASPEDFGFDPPNVDLFFCYPWSDEEALIPSLFERHAGLGALLLTFHGSDDLRLRRKVGAGTRKRRRVR